MRILITVVAMSFTACMATAESQSNGLAVFADTNAVLRFACQALSKNSATKTEAWEFDAMIHVLATPTFLEREGKSKQPAETIKVYFRRATDEPARLKPDQVWWEFCTVVLSLDGTVLSMEKFRRMLPKP